MGCELMFPDETKHRFGWWHSLADVNRLLCCYFSEQLALLLFEGSSLECVLLRKGLHFHHNNKCKEWTVTGRFLLWLWCMPLSPALLCWWMSNRILFPQCQNKASKYGITAVTENVTVPLLYMSARINIMATLAALSLLFETMMIHRKCL